MTRRQTRIVIITAVVLGLFCLGMVFWALTRPPEPIAEPVPFPTTAAPSTTTTTTSTTISATPPTTTTTTAPPTTTPAKPPAKAPVAPPKTTTPPAAATAPPVAPANGLCQAAQWQRDTQYNAGAVVQHNGAVWYARSWSYNAEPGANAENAWIRAINCQSPSTMDDRPVRG